MKLRNRNVLLTGGSSGIGLSLVEALTARGNRVITCARHPEPLSNIKLHLPDVDIVQADLSTENDREHVVRYVENNYGCLDILINNAATRTDIDFRDPTAYTHEAALEIDTNFIAPVDLTMRCLPMLMQSHQAAIVNITSILAILPKSSYPVYGATKAALASFTLSMRELLRETSIRVYEVIPSLTATSMTAGLQDSRRKLANPRKSGERIVNALERDRYRIIIGRNRYVAVFARVSPALARRLL